jgi:hypothetical protein
MKKITGLVALLFITAAMYSQDSSSTSSSQLPQNRSWSSDTAGMYRWNDTGYYRRNKNTFDSAMSIRRGMWNQNSSYFVRGTGDTIRPYVEMEWMRDSVNYLRRNWDSSTYWTDANRWNEIYDERNGNMNSNQGNAMNQQGNTANQNEGTMQSQDSSHVRKPGMDDMTNKTRSQVDSANSSPSDYQPATTDSASSAGKTKGGKDRVYMKNNMVMVSKNGVASKLTKSLTLNDGTKVMTDGTIKTPDGQTMKLKNGESISLGSKGKTSQNKKSK